MSSQIAGEGWFFFHSFLFGIILTVFYDLFRILRRVFSHGNFWVSVEDLFFWILTSCGIFYMLYYENNGVFRWFAVFGAGIGMFLYKKTASEFLVSIISGILQHILHFWGSLLKKLFRPLRILLKKLGKILKRKIRMWRRGIIYRLTGWRKAIKIKLDKCQRK